MFLVSRSLENIHKAQHVGAISETRPPEPRYQASKEEAEHSVLITVVYFSSHSFRNKTNRPTNRRDIS